MAPFSMKCLSCGEFIYKGRKFNARKETTTEKYYSINIFRFYIRCTRCSTEITFKTDPKNMDYQCERGAIRNFEPWREEGVREETEEERLDRLEREEGETAMEKLETKTLDSRREMQIADALDEVRARNARNERVDEEEIVRVLQEMRGEELVDQEREREEKELDEIAKKVFREGGDQEGKFVRRVLDDVKEEKEEEAAPPIPTFKKTAKRKRDLGAALGIKKKKSLVD
jgi:hypothetical protein